MQKILCGVEIEFGFKEAQEIQITGPDTNIFNIKKEI